MPRFAVLSWNLFHGRSQPPAGRELLAEFAAALADAPWDLALLQEAPPRWLRPLCRACGAHGASALTSRNLGAALRGPLARRHPDVLKSNEGGSNQLLVRGGWRIEDVRRLTLTLLPERRRLVWALLAHPRLGRLAAGNLHATADDRPAAARDALVAARASCAWAGELPLVLGGDLNLRQSETAWAFEPLAALGLAGARPGRAIDHLLHRGLDPVAPAEPLGPEGFRAGGLRLSDHAPVAATYELRSAHTATGGD